MLGTFLDNVSALLNINTDVLPNIITFVVVAFIIYLSLRGQLSWITLGSIYAIAMAMLTILGVDSVFNIITIIETYVIGGILWT